MEEKTKVSIKNEQNDKTCTNLSAPPKTALIPHLPATNAAPGLHVYGEEKAPLHGFLGRLTPTG